MTTSSGTVKRSLKSCRLDNVHGHIFTPRSYQVELLDIGLGQNTIVCLGSGTGKTFIAVMLIKELARQVRGSFEEAKRTIYLVDSIPLVQQQAHVIEMHSDLSVGAYYSDLGVDLWTDEKWNNEFSSRHVLVMTPQIFLSVVVNGFITLSKVNLIVLDECHHAVQDHPYAKIMKYLDTTSLESHPKILGLTASILSSQCRNPVALQNLLNELENTLHCTVETASDMIMADLYSTKPEEILIDCDSYNDSTGLVEEINSLLASALDFLQDCVVSDGDGLADKDPRSGAKLVISECQHILHELGPWCAARVAQAFAKQLARVEEYEANEAIRTFIQMAATIMRLIQKIVDDLFDSQVQTLEEFFMYMSPKVVRMIEVLHEYKPDDNFTIIGDDQFSDSGSDESDDSLNDVDEDHSDDDTGTSAWSKSNSTPRNAKPSSHYVVVRRTSAGNGSDNNSAEAMDEDGICGIVFVERKHTAFVLNKLIVELCNWDPDLYFVRSHYVTGQGVAGAVREPDSQCQKQEEVLRKFRQREINLLVSTNVLEEGVDVPKCNLVMRFSPPSTYRSYVQSKGRARAVNSKYYMLVDYNCCDKFKEDLGIFKGIEEVLLKHCHNHDDHSTEEIVEEDVDSLLPPYVSLHSDGSSCVTMTSAIRLVNKYCAKLPSDVFTHLTPKCSIETKWYPDRIMYQAQLQLPINSPMKKPIIGVEMPSRRLAQMAAALKTCEILHESHELDDHLLPVGKELIKYEDEESEWEDHELHGQARPGTTKRKQYYCKKTASALIGRPRPRVRCCVYVLNMRLTCPITEEQNTRGRAIHKPESTSRGFGIICEKKFPKVPCFPVFTRSGEVTVSIDLVADDVSLSEVELDRLFCFHRFIFNHVLRLEKSPMTFDPERAKASYIVGPVNKDSSGRTVLDWDFITLIENSSLVPNRKRFSKDVPKETFVFDRKTFEDAVVMPSYRNIDQPQYFYVAEIREDLNLRSPFPSPELYDTFEHYYSSKYSLDITNLEQPLLDVDHTSARLNLLTPRYMNQKGVALPTSSAETRKAKRENLQQKQILVPELCDIHPFPASLWRKAVCIPTILYRMNYLLIAEELRIQISEEARLGLMKPTVEFEFPPLRFGFCDIDGFDPCTCTAACKASLNDSKDCCQNKSLKDNNVTCKYNSNGCCVCVRDQTGSIVCASEKGKAAHAGGCLLIDLEANGRPSEVLCGNCIAHISEDDARCCSIKQTTDCGEIFGQLNGVGKFCVASANGNVKKANDVFSDLKHHHDHHACNDRIRESDRIEESFETQHDSKSQFTDLHQCCKIQCKYKNSSRNFFSSDLGLSYGPSPCDIIQTLTMSNANDFFNLERLETIGDSFLKFAITVYLYATYPGIHEGKLSYLRSIQVSNYNLYKLGKKKGLPGCMVAVKFEPIENWLPPGYVIRSDAVHAQLTVAVNVSENGPSSVVENSGDVKRWKTGDFEGRRSEIGGDRDFLDQSSEQQRQFTQELEECTEPDEDLGPSASKILIPYNLQTQHSLPDKSIADCVEALIGCYLVSCGHRAALYFMAWLGLHVLPMIEKRDKSGPGPDILASSTAKGFGMLQALPSPLLLHVPNAAFVLEIYLNGFDEFEKTIRYKFRDRSYLLQAFTHASYHYNVVTDCYQRLEFLGDAILDYVITRHLYEDSTKHSPGILTDLRSALVNNNIFASLAVKWNFHKYFKAISPQLFHVIEAFVKWQSEHDDIVLDEELECSRGDEDIEIPKALGDIFESVAGAIYLDSGMSLDVVWTVYYRMMKRHIDAFIEKIPKSPVRELLELEPETAKFEKPVRTFDGKIRVTVNVVGKGSFQGIGRNYRIAKSAAAKWALKSIKANVHTANDYIYMQ